MLTLPTENETDWTACARQLQSSSPDVLNRLLLMLGFLYTSAGDAQRLVLEKQPNGSLAAFLDGRRFAVLQKDAAGVSHLA